MEDSVCDERSNDTRHEVCEPEERKADWHIFTGVVVRNVQDAVLVIVSPLRDTIVNLTYWNEAAHEQPYEETTSEEACTTLHEKLASSTYGPNDDLYGYPAVGSQLLA